MLMTISTTHQPATDLGHLLRKHPGKAHAFEQSFGRAHVFYPKATEQVCTAALLLEVDPVGLVRNRRGPASEGRSLEQYVSRFVVYASDPAVTAVETCPADLKKMLERGMEVYTLANLHAKVFVLGSTACVGSANPSSYAANRLLAALVWTNEKKMSFRPAYSSAEQQLFHRAGKTTLGFRPLFTVF
jgi:hypothetical protein